ncbi:MAG: ATP-dependent sacrificial sulfur transferase LarE [Nitrospiraceae bacterium]|nr:ATP-dependent sacrificial sulfur transferase LarE [Nitrospiraceae bacterium]
MNFELENAVGRLEELLAQFPAAAVGFSGGIDSTYLAAVAARVLPGQTIAVTADSPSLPRDELEACEKLAAELGIEHFVVNTREFSNPAYLKNDGLRCFYCKSELMEALAPLAQERNAVVLLGVNSSDKGDYRPGQSAAKHAGARFPLLEAGMTKEMIREHARTLGLPNWDKPQAACLASRIPYGTPITLQTLSRVERAERYLRSLGFRDIRVRDYGQTARIEVGREELLACAGAAAAVDAELKRFGYDYVTLDLAGFSSGNLNRDLAKGGHG